MKTLFSTFMILLSAGAFSQVIIGDDIGTATDKSSVLIEFASGQNKGLILPYVRTLPSGTNLSEGTIILDASDENKAQVKYHKGSGVWLDLSSGNQADISGIMSNQPLGVVENSNAGTIIGSATASVDGVLVLESTNKAMILPIVNSTADVPNAAPGMMVYVNKTGAKRLAVYNGAVWTYWKK